MALIIPTVHDVVFAVIVLAILGVAWSLLQPYVAERLQKPVLVAIVIVAALWMVWFFQR